MPSYWTIVVSPASTALDGVGRDTRAAIGQMGMDAPRSVNASKVYFLEGSFDRPRVEILAAELLADPVAERYEVHQGLTHRDAAAASIEVHPLPGVMDPVALTTRTAVERMIDARGWTGQSVAGVRTARRYTFDPPPDAGVLDTIARRLLYNPCIERAFIRCEGRDDALPAEFPAPVHRPFVLRSVCLKGMDAERLAALSRQKHLFLSADEMRAIQSEFDRLGRDPTDLELETLAQTWSEHCVHKTLKSAVTYRGAGFGRPGKVEVKYSNLFKDTIVAATRMVNKPWCLSVFHDNAGVIALDDEYGVAFKVETHNHPSAIEPYGGAATGVGGCIRDIMGCGLGAKPIASTDVFCLAEPDYDDAKLPTGVLHPRRVLRGVVGGVRDYGNRMGIPTVNGAICFDRRFLANPLVFCGCVGLIPRDRISKKPCAGDLIVVAGGRTGRDGIHGATFSSAELGESHADEFSHAVQIGNAIEEKKLLDAMLLARDHESGCLYTAVTDCGAGGLSSAIGEMGEELGAVVDLEQAPLKYEGLAYDEIWISEAQERMVFAVPPARIETFLRLFAGEEVEATVIGRFSDDRVLRVRYEGKTVGELSMAFLHHGLPMPARTAAWSTGGGGAARAGMDSMDGMDGMDRMDRPGGAGVSTRAGGSSRAGAASRGRQADRQ
ncbi:MAG: phosphoribosylformylglycinamidine synthase, partial [Phycisphaerales bacterium]